MISDLAGRRVLVTGASRGGGAAVARGFGQAGAAVAVHYHVSSAAEEVARDIRASGSFACTLAADLTRVAEAARLVEHAAEALGGIDVLVNNAGDLVQRRLLQEVDEAFVTQLVALNASSVVFACKAAAPLLADCREGAIVNTVSVARRTGGGGGSMIYAATKGFVASLTRGLAKELAPAGIRVNAVAPGIIDTDLHARVTPPEALAAFAARTPLGRLGTARDCVGAYLFLSSPSLSGFITGQIIDVDGGLLLT